MEIVGSFLDEEWESLSQIFSSSSEHPDFLLHCDASTLFSTNLQIPSPTFPPSDPNISQESSEIDEALFLNIQGNHQHHINTFDSININDDGFMLPVFPDDVMEEFLRLKPENRASHHSPQEMMPKTKSEAEAPPFEDKSEDFSPHENPKKKPRNAYKSRAAQSKKSKKTIQEKKNINEEEGNKVSCSSYSSEDESNAKTRATRGSATDPQSLYARKRRERINERLKILQNLVPNGTKVDISTMLEEAVHYVKFLQLQIKLLSSDNLWMYAPLAYNGMDIGIYQNISPDLRP